VKKPYPPGSGICSTNSSVAIDATIAGAELKNRSGK
jgi:hypothetical protein